MNARLVARNSFWLLVGRVAVAALNLLLTVLIARYLGEAGYGQYAFIASLAYLGNTASTFGMDTLVMRSAARDAADSSREATTALLLQLALSAGYIAVIVIASLFWEGSRTALVVYLLILLPLALGTIYSALLRGVEKMALHAAYTLAGALLQVVGAGIVLWRGGDLLALALAIVAGQTGATLLASWLVRRAGLRLTWGGISAETLQTTLKASWTLALLAILAVFFAQLPIFTLRALTDDTSIGQFSAASRLVDGSKMVPAALFGALFPPLVRGAGRSLRYKRFFWGLVGLFGFGVLGGVALATPAVRLLYDGYAASIPVLQILLVGLLPHLFRLRYSFELVTQGHERLALNDLALTVLVALPIYVGAVSLMGLRGAAWAVVATTALQAALHYRSKRRLMAATSRADNVGR